MMQASSGVDEQALGSVAAGWGGPLSDSDPAALAGWPHLAPSTPPPGVTSVLPPRSLRRRQRGNGAAASPSSFPPSLEGALPASSAPADGSIPPWIRAAAATSSNAVRRGAPRAAWIAAGIVGIGVGALLPLLVLQGVVRTARTELTLRAIDPSGAPLVDARAYVDGRLACEQLPCTAADLAPGMHRVRIESGPLVTEQPILVPSGEASTAILTMGASTQGETVTRTTPAEGLGKDALVQVVREALAEQQAAAASRVAAGWRGHIPFFPTSAGSASAAPAEAGPAAGEDGPSADTPDWLTQDAMRRAMARAVAGKPQPSAQGTEAPSTRDEAPGNGAPPGRGTILIESDPPTNIVVDGRTTGTHKSVRVHVEPGIHVVAFVHPELGRKVRTVRIEAGSVTSATATFP